MRCAHVPGQHQGCIQRRLDMVWIGTSTVGREGRGRSPLDETETPSSLSCQCLFLPRANRADKGAMPVSTAATQPPSRGQCVDDRRIPSAVSAGKAAAGTA
jgi:hypothetical protein